MRIMQLLAMLLASATVLLTVQPANAAPTPTVTQQQLHEAAARLVKEGAIQVVHETSGVASTTPGAIIPRLGGSATPAVSIGLGWYVYIRLSPQDQSFIMQAGAIGVATVVCLATAGIACAIATGAAGIIVAWVATYYHYGCWMEFKFTYGGHLSSVNPWWRC